MLRRTGGSGQLSGARVPCEWFPGPRAHHCSPPGVLTLRGSGCVALRWQRGLGVWQGAEEALAEEARRPLLCAPPPSVGPGPVSPSLVSGGQVPLFGPSRLRCADPRPTRQRVGCHPGPPPLQEGSPPSPSTPSFPPFPFLFLEGGGELLKVGGWTFILFYFQTCRKVAGMNSCTPLVQLLRSLCSARFVPSCSLSLHTCARVPHSAHIRGRTHGHTHTRHVCLSHLRARRRHGAPGPLHVYFSAHSLKAASSPLSRPSTGFDQPSWSKPSDQN